MSLESGSMRRIPKENQLPLRVEEHSLLAESGESDVWKSAVLDSNEQERMIALKQVRREAFASDEEMKSSKEFYDFLKNFPEFGKFVPETLYFKARMTADSAPQAFALQRFIHGKTIDQIGDEEMYRDPEVVRQLIEFSKAAVEILKSTRKGGSFKPDFGTSAAASEEAWKQGNRFGDSRFSTNIIVTDAPDEKGRRVLFVDTGVQPDERVNKVREIMERQGMGRLRQFNFNRWTKKLGDILKELDQNDTTDTTR